MPNRKIPAFSAYYFIDEAKNGYIYCIHNTVNELPILEIFDYYTMYRLSEHKKVTLMEFSTVIPFKYIETVIQYDDISNIIPHTFGSRQMQEVTEIKRSKHILELNIMNKEGKLWISTHQKMHRLMKRSKIIEHRKAIITLNDNKLPYTYDIEYE